MHKLAGYNGNLHSYSQSILDASNQYKNVKFKISFKKTFSLSEIIFFYQQKEDSYFFFMPFFNKQKNKIINDISLVYYRPDYIPLELPLYECKSINKNILESIPKNAYVFLATMNNYLNPMIPLMEALIKKGEKIIIVINLEAKKWDNFKKFQKNFNIVYIENFFNKEIKDRFQKNIDSIKTKWENSRNFFKRNVKWKNVYFFDIFERNYREIYYNYIPHVISYIDMAENLVNKIKPKALFVARLRRSVENSFNEVFRKYKLPTYMLLHGHISNEDNRYFSDGYFDRVEKIFVWDKLQKDILLSKKYEKVKNKQIIISGNPAWDHIAKLRKTKKFLKKLTIKKELKIKTSEYIVLVTQEFPLAGYLKAIKVIEKYKKYTLIIKVHPSEDKNRYNEIKSDRVIVVKTLKNIDLHSLLYNSILVLTHSSTVNLEAILCGRIVGTLLFPEFSHLPLLYDLNYYKMPIFKNEYELENYIKKGIKEMKNTSRIEFTGNAINKILNEILKGRL